MLEYLFQYSVIHFSKLITSNISVSRLVFSFFVCFWGYLNSAQGLLSLLCVQGSLLSLYSGVTPYSAGGSNHSLAR